MNGVAMFLQHVQSSNSTNTPLKSNKREEISESFHQLLDENIVNVSDFQNPEQGVLKNGAGIDDVIQQFSSDEEALLKAIVQNEMKNQDDHIGLTSSDVVNNVELMHDLLHFEGFVLGAEQNGISSPNIDKELAELFTQIQPLFSQLKTEEDIRNASPKILELLHHWQKLTKPQAKLVPLNSMSDTNENPTVIKHQSQHAKIAGLTPVDSDEMNGLQAWRKQETREARMWHTILDTFQKREQLSGKQRYNTESNVTIKDVAKWLGNAVEQEGLTVTTVQTNQTVPISKLEQHVIHINQPQPSNSQDQQFMNQLEKIMESAKLSVLPNQRNHLTITLRPDNMGELMVRFTQVNGEIMVKILVTTAAAKEMLESNIHQLKNMFSPHQVVVEKQDAIAQSASDLQKEQGNGQLKEQEEQHSNQSNHENNQKQTEESFEKQFKELLLNEKV
ncbi:flagellar hook-length control protein FliK [Oceanobacillus sp. FSL K6-2867]|uniref:flagellar hook-length control protein FliK n=1 Tax=Oceanobacillus sp. FSL K6-2867 TaxID=2954748 RepID=UPI0030DB9BC2